MKITYETRYVQLSALPHGAGPSNVNCPALLMTTPPAGIRH